MNTAAKWALGLTAAGGLATALVVGLSSDDSTATTGQPGQAPPVNSPFQFQGKWVVWTGQQWLSWDGQQWVPHTGTIPGSSAWVPTGGCPNCGPHEEDEAGSSGSVYKPYDPNSAYIQVFEEGNAAPDTSQMIVNMQNVQVIGEEHQQQRVYAPGAAPVQMIDFDRLEKEAQQNLTGLPPGLRTDPDEPSAEWLKLRVEQGDKSVFYMPYALKDRYTVSKHFSKIMVIHIDTMDGFKWLSDLLFTCMLMYGSQAEKNIGPLINWLNYHEFVISGEVKKRIEHQMNHFLCTVDSRFIYIPPEDPVYGVKAQEDHLPGFPWENELKTRQILRSGQTCALNNTTPQYVYTWMNNVLFQDGFQVLLEYTAARYMNLGFGSAANPALGREVGSQLMSAAFQAGSIAALAVILTAAGSASSVPVAGWIAAGIGALSALVAGLFGMAQAQRQNEVLRETISIRLDNMLDTWFQKPTIPDYLSGYKLGLLMDRAPHWIGVTDPLWNNYLRTTGRTEWITPQMPFFYNLIDFELIAGVQVPFNYIQLLKPTFGTDGYVDGWKMVGSGFDELVSRHDLNIGHRRRS